MIKERSIYLHFFDRELRNSINRNLRFNDDSARRILLTALFMTRLPLYVSLSNMYESLDDLPSAINTAFTLERLGLLRMITNMRSREEFFVSRKSLYSFDKNRYSHYFGEEETNWPTEPLIVTEDTTKILRKKLLDYFGENNSFPEDTRKSLQESLISNKKDALTFNFFRKTIQDEYQQQHLSDVQYQKSIADIRIAISQQYTERYLLAQDGTIITGIPGLTFYDSLAKDTFLTNYQLFSELLRPLFLASPFFFDPIAYRQSSFFCPLYNLLQKIVEGLNCLANNITQAIAEIKQYRYRSKNICVFEDFLEDCIGLYDHVLSREKEMGVRNTMQTTFLLTVATQLELDILLKKLKSVSPVSRKIGDFSYFLTVIGESTVYVVKSQMGQGGVGGSILTLEKAVRILAPTYVIMGGIAWGGDQKKQNIGDIIISNQVWDYDIDRVNPDGSKTYRGSIYSSSPSLVQMFNVLCADRQMTFIARYGMVASGSDLLDNKNYVDDLKKEHPELIGGDMESAGMAAVCNNKTDWIMVKGICDWGYNKNCYEKEEQQSLAANNAMEIIVLLLKYFSS